MIRKRSQHCALLLAAQFLQIDAKAQSRNSPIVIVDVVNIQSKVLKEGRSLYIAKPTGYADSAERYPVLYLLDGETLFRYTNSVVEFLASNDRVPKMLVVAVASESVAKRTRDLTPPSSEEIDNRFSPGNGGADDFLTFLADELVPFVENSYRTRPYRVLVGHSFGGLFALHALSVKPKLFNAYLSIDPSLSWNRGTVVAEVDSVLSKTKDLQADLYFTAANDTGKLPRDIEKLAAILGDKAPPRLRWKFEWLKQETHASIPLRGIHQGLDTIFDGWHLTDPLELFDKGGIEAIHRHFREGGKRYGYDRSTSPFTVSLVVAGLISKGRLEEASAVLLHHPKAYPPPWNQLDALARAYSQRGNVAQAIHYYTLSLKENPRNGWAIQKLGEMGVKVEDVLPNRP